MMMSDYEPVFMSNESITGRKYRVGDVIKMKVVEVMDDGVKAVCMHGRKMTPPEDRNGEMREHMGNRYKEAMSVKGGEAY